MGITKSQDGRLLCESLPTYGTGKEAGNEANYVVGMSTCYPKPGSVKVSDGEVLTQVSNYSSDRQHTGVMGLFYILVAEPQQQTAPEPALCFSFPVPCQFPKNFTMLLTHLAMKFLQNIILLPLLSLNSENY